MAEITRLPAPIHESYDWQAQGACLGIDTEAFFSPDAERGPRRRNREAAAKSVCARCPVVDACREHALSVQEPYGVWGGLTINERADIIAARKATERRAG